MRRCGKCKGLMEKSVLPEHTEDLGGLVVTVLNAVQVFRCGTCKSEIVAIPDMEGLARSAAITRALHPVRLAGHEVKFLRRVLDMKQKAFAKAMDLAPETVSRWETDSRGIGGGSEKLVRHNVCALLHKKSGPDYDPALIANMKFTSLEDGETLSPIRMVRVRAQDDSTEWGEVAA